MTEEQNAHLNEQNRRLQEALKAAQDEQLRDREKLHQLEEELKKQKEENSAVLKLASDARKSRKGGLSLKTFLLGMAAGALCLYGLQKTVFKPVENPVEQIAHQAKEDFDEVITETFAGFTAADFQNAVLGESTGHQELIVMEQPVAIESTITKEGFYKLPAFQKVKNIVYHGSGVYTVDLSLIDAEHIMVDEEEKTVTVLIPHAELQYVNPDLSATEFAETETGWLAFGDLTLTAEQQNELEGKAVESMRERLGTDELMESADEFSRMKTWEIFQPLVTSVSPEYKVVIQTSDVYEKEERH